jgi:hypothetical protein
MSLREFIKQNREALDSSIRGALNRPDYKLNDEGLYRWAQSAGVRI